MKNETVTEIAGLVRPSLAHLGIDLVDVQWSGKGNGAVLRLVIDRAGGVTLDDCERASSAASAVLDVYDPIDSRYRLEVTSPGAERPIVHRDDWVSALGRKVNVRVRSGELETVLEGRLVALTNGDAEIEVRERRGHHVEVISLSTVLAARIAVDI
jgi:ribosome maturation factor RimP